VDGLAAVGILRPLLRSGGGRARALVSYLVPEETRGTAFGMYHGIVGITLLPASLIAGWLWQSINLAAPFYSGSASTVLGMVGMVVFVRK
jgi:hypothetical protein